MIATALVNFAVVFAVTTSSLGGFLFIPAPSPIPDEPWGQTNPRPPAPTVIVKDARLTVEAQDVALQWVVDEIAKQADLTIHGTGLLGGLTISTRLESVPVDQGLKELLQGFDVFFLYTPVNDRPTSLRSVWIYQRGQGTLLVPVPAEQWASTSELERGLSDPDPEVRALAIESLVERWGERALDKVLQALLDTDNYVRERALDAAAGAGLELPAQQLQILASADTSDEVRRLALQNFADHSEVSVSDVRALLEAARFDPSPAVQKEAEQILKSLERASNQPHQKEN